MKPVLDKITKVSDKVCYGVSWLSMAMCVIMTVLLVVDVLGRKIGIFTIKGCYEIIQMCLCTFIFSTWSYVQSIHGHIHVVMFIQKMGKIARFICFGVTSVISTVTMGIGAYAVYKQIFTMIKTGESTANLLIPFWPFYIVECVAFVLFTITLLIDCVKAFVAMFNEEVATEVQSTWV